MCQMVIQYLAPQQASYIVCQSLHKSNNSWIIMAAAGAGPAAAVGVLERQPWTVICWAVSARAQLTASCVVLNISFIPSTSSTRNSKFLLSLLIR